MRDMARERKYQRWELRQLDGITYLLNPKWKWLLHQMWEIRNFLQLTDLEEVEFLKKLNIADDHTWELDFEVHEEMKYARQKASKMLSRLDYHTKQATRYFKILQLKPLPESIIEKGAE